MVVGLVMLTKAVAVFLLIILAPRSEGSKEVSTFTCDQQINEVEDSFRNASGCSPDALSHNNFINGNCFNSFEYIMKKLTSDHILNITCNVELSTVIELTNLTNITITGHNNPTIDCNNNGGLHFTSCNGIKFEGIIWKQNGSPLNDSLLLNFTFLLNFSSILFKRHSKLIFNKFAPGNHFASYNYSNLTFEDDSIITFNNIGVISSHNHSSVTFKGNSTVVFTGIGSIHSENYSSITFDDNSTVLFTVNSFKVVYSVNHCCVTFKGNSTVKFSDKAYSYNGSVIYSEHYSSVIFDENSNVSFSSNRLYRGTIHSKDHSNVTYKGNSKVMCYNNTAVSYGGAIFSYNHSFVTFEENTKVSFTDNKADEGGAIFSMSDCSVVFTGYSRVTIKENVANSAGALRSHTNSIIVFTENTRVMFTHNVAQVNGGAMDLYVNTDVVFKGNSDVTYDNNTASNIGGVCACYSNVSFIDNATVNFVNNKAREGGGLYLTGKYNAIFEKAQVDFYNNTADRGAAIFMDVTDAGGKINFAMQGIGKINFYNNTANIHGNSIFMDINHFYIFANKAYYIEQLLGITSCNISQLDEQQDGLREYITVPPYKIVLQDINEKPLICNKLDNVTCDCESYYLNNVMLGQEVSLKGMVYDYLDNHVSLEILIYDYFSYYYYNYYNYYYYSDYSDPVETVFQIDRKEQNTSYNIQSVNQDSSQGLDFMITGNKITSNYDFSLEVATYRAIKLPFRVTIQLTIQLSPCYLGFQHNNESMKCECYDREDIVRCDGVISNIRRGYWLGTVEDKVTATTCPINFCDFTCCETSNGYHSLLPDRKDQCTSHRSGVACGSCKEGYTLSYGADCISVDKCTAGWIILVVTLTILYWIAIVVGAFAMMHYKLPIGYLYALTYYYSIVDVLLGQHLYLYSSLHTTTDVLFSVFNLSPQLLRQLCLAKGLSGVDVYFIHYVHPLVILLILIKIVLLARCSQRLSLFISKGIIHVICLLLLLSYTSIITISLLLIRSLKFYDVDKTYTYLSPDLEYLHGRHLVYFIVAMICVITVVIGLPLILLLEPFLNRKINFTRIKPLLDQFQGCFKDQYRWFASFYMICRLVQITIVVFSSDFSITQYILIVTSVVISLIHVIVRPYSKKTLNIFDGIVLHLITIVAIVPVFDSFNSTSIITITFILIILPLLTFFIMGFITHKEVMRRLFVRICRPKNTEHVMKEENDNERPIKEFDMIIDESMRTNATMCDV